MEDNANTTPTTTTDAAPGGEATAPTQPDYAAEVGRLTAELEKAHAQSGKHKADYDALLRKTSLEGKVTDLNLALKVLDPERHLKNDGTVDEYALYADFPSLAPGVRGPTAPDGGGGFHRPYGGSGLESVARTGSPGEINAAFDAELKGGRK